MWCCYPIGRNCSEALNFVIEVVSAANNLDVDINGSQLGGSVSAIITEAHATTTARDRICWSRGGPCLWYLYFTGHYLNEITKI